MATWLGTGWPFKKWMVEVLKRGTTFVPLYQNSIKPTLGSVDHLTWATNRSHLPLTAGVLHLTKFEELAVGR